MSNNTIPEPPKATGKAAKHQSGPRRPLLRAAIAEQRRAAFLRFLDKHNLKPAGLARLAGLPTANAIYNFLNGSASSLSQTTIERILAAMPGTSMADLMGSPDSGRPEEAQAASRLAPMQAQSGTADHDAPSPDRPIDRDELALDVTFELQPLNDAIISLGVAVEGAAHAARAVRPSETAVEVAAAWTGHITLVRECTHLVQARAAALVEAATRLIMAR